MLLVGLTGGIASGKSTVSRRLAQVHGFPVIDADQVARAVVEPGTAALVEIVAHFGPGVLLADGGLDRARLGAIVFADPAARADLNAITHPRIAAEVQRRIAALADHDGPVLVDSPLLVEMGHAAAYPEIVVVAASREVQHARLLADRAMDPIEAWQRIDSQAPLADKLAVATHVIDNDGTLEQLHTRIDEVAAALRAGATTA